MTNVTLAVDEEILKLARIHALEHGTSLNAVMREFLEQYAGAHHKYAEVTARLIAKSEQFNASSEGSVWQRDNLYER